MWLHPPSETSLTRWGSGLSSRHHGTRALQVPDTTFLSTSACPLSYLDLGDQTHQKLLTMGSEYTSQAFIPTCALLMTSSHLLHWPPTLHPQTQPRYHWSRKPSLTAPHWVLHSPSPCFQSQWVMFFEYLRYTQHPWLSRKYCKQVISQAVWVLGLDHHHLLCLPSQLTFIGHLQYTSHSSKILTYILSLDFHKSYKI